MSEFQDLVKGQKVDLTKGNPGLTKIQVGLGWDVKAGNGADFDLDAVALCLTNDKLVDKSDMVFYGNLAHSSGAIKHSGDNLTGVGEGVDEAINIDLSKVPDSINKIVFVVSIYQANARRQNFGQVNNAFIQLVNSESNENLVKFDLSEDYSVETSMILGEIYRHNGEWKFNAKDEGIEGELGDVRAKYL